MRWILSWMSSKGTINTLQWRQITCIYVYGTFGKWIKKLNKKNVYWCNHFSLQNVFFCNSETTTGGCSIKKAVWETSQNLPKKTPVLESPFNKVVGLKASFPEGIFKNTFFTEHLQKTASGERTIICTWRHFTLCHHSRFSAVMIEEKTLLKSFLI